EAVAVGALGMARERLFDLVQRLGLHLDERKLDVILDVSLGRFGRIEDALALAIRTFRPHVPDLLLDFAQDFPSALLENLLKFGMALARLPGLSLRRNHLCLHDPVLPSH